jgi:hypothetical protein
MVLSVIVLFLILAGPSSGAGDALHVPLAESPVGGAGLSPSITHTLHLPLVNVGFYSYPPSTLGVQVYYLNATSVERVIDVGATWLRLPLNWSHIEPVNTTPENYQWPAALEKQLRRLAERNVRVLLTLSSNPSWAATYPGGPIDQVDMSELVEFVEAAVARYSAPPYNIKYWELYNEPDNGSEYFASTGEVGYFGYNPQGYVDHLAAVYQPIKNLDPESQVVFGGIAYDAWDTWGGPFARDFLDGVLQAGGGDYFDVMNFHYFPAFRQFWEPYGLDILGKLNYLRAELASYGLHKPFICTETGIWSDEASGSSDELQSRYVPQVFVRSLAGDLKLTIWFMLVDSSALSSRKWGLLNPDLSPKPAYHAYQVLARQLSRAEYVRTLDPSQTGSDQIEAYEFALSDDSLHVLVAWTNDDLPHPLSIVTPHLIKVEKYGTETLIHDGDDGTLDGKVTLALGPSPLYLRWSP